jgi:hypothetical protein
VSLAGSLGRTFGQFLPKSDYFLIFLQKKLKLGYTVVMKAPTNCLISIKRRLTEINEALSRLENRLAVAPCENIIIRNGHFYRTPQEEYLGKAKEALIAPLAQKRLDISLRNVLLQEKATLERAQKSLESQKSVDDVYNAFPEQLKKYVLQEDFTKASYIQQWSQPEMSFNRRRVIETNIYTLKGEKVRSKSEALIADRLFTANIPYHYEQEYYVPNGRDGYRELLPDFTVLNKRTCETWFWEHFGKMDDDKYKEDVESKLEGYSNDGIFPGEHLILTFETRGNSLNTRYIELLINKYLV